MTTKQPTLAWTATNWLPWSRSKRLCRSAHQRRCPRRAKADPECLGQVRRPLGWGGSARLQTASGL